MSRIKLLETLNLDETTTLIKGTIIDLEEKIEHSMKRRSWEIMDYSITQEGNLQVTICETAYNPEQNDYSYRHCHFKEIANKDQFEILNKYD